jgi:ankyrin repeat protein
MVRYFCYNTAMLTLFLFLFSSSALAQEVTPSDLLWESLREDDVSTVVSLINSGISVDSASYTDTPLTYAIKRDSIEMVAALLDLGANPNLVQPVSQFSPLMVAAKHNNPEAVELLLLKNANVNYSGVFGRNPLHVAALHNGLEVAHLLLTKTDVDVNTRGKLCPLAVASRQGYLDFVNLILAEAKIAPSVKCLTSAKEMAALNQHNDVLSVLNLVK